MTNPILTALHDVINGERPGDYLNADARDWFRLALGAQYGDDGALRGPVWGSPFLPDTARALLPYAIAALAEVGAVLSAAEHSALIELDDAPLPCDVEFLLCAMGLADWDEDGCVRNDDTRERWSNVLYAMETP